MTPKAPWRVTAVRLATAANAATKNKKARSTRFLFLQYVFFLAARLPLLKQSGQRSFEGKYLPANTRRICAAIPFCRMHFSCRVGVTPAADKGKSALYAFFVLANRCFAPHSADEVARLKNLSKFSFQAGEISVFYNKGAEPPASILPSGVVCRSAVPAF